MKTAVRKYLFWGLLCVLGVTFFTRNDLKGVAEVAGPVLQEPLQTPLLYPKSIQFTRNGYVYDLTPVYGYEINALVVGKMDYWRFSMDKFDLVFPADLCLIWGSNARRQLYRDSGVKFSQDCRWCWVSWNRDVKFNLSEMSNNHLLINDKEVWAAVKEIVRGDQVRIAGKLVNVKAQPVDNPLSSPITWNSSVSRTDTGAGACEVIYVEKIEIIKKANIAARSLFRLALYGLIGLIAWNIFDFFRTTRPRYD